LPEKRTVKDINNLTKVFHRDLRRYQQVIHNRKKNKQCKNSDENHYIGKEETMQEKNHPASNGILRVL